MTTEGSEVERRLARLVEACQSDGIRVTHQRAVILGEIARASGHPTADAMFRRVRRRVPSVSRDTVYRTLAMLEKLGLVRKVDLAGQAARYEFEESPHHHLVCTACGRVEDFADAAMDRLQLPAAAREWGQVQNIQVQIRGVCGACRAKRERDSLGRQAMQRTDQDRG